MFNIDTKCGHCGHSFLGKNCPVDPRELVHVCWKCKRLNTYDGEKMVGLTKAEELRIFVANPELAELVNINPGPGCVLIVLQPIKIG